MATESVYRPHLDGLRAIAVYLVVLFHAGLSVFSGGYVGVDLFFVLSGFLVTQLLVRDLAGGASIRYGRFYSRRFRRLLPAAFVTLLATALVFAAVNPSQALAAVGSLKAAFLYSANWYFIRQSTDYFAAGITHDPALQFWSLAIEEQFYLVWPLALGGIFWVAGRLPRRRLLFVRATVAAAALASVLWALHLRSGSPNRAYFGTDARAYQLLAGASLALIPDLIGSLRRFRRTTRVAAVVGLAALLALASSLSDMDPVVRGIAVTGAAVVILVGIECADGGWLKRVLSSDVFVYLGKISYGTYLWHWPLILVTAELVDFSPRAMAVFACVVATGLASLSFQLLERPVRTSKLLDRHRAAVIATGLTISVVGALILIPAITDSRSASGAPDAAATDTFTPVPSWVDTGRVYTDGFGAQQAVTCVGKDPDLCTIVHGTGRHLLLMGDSTAQMYIPALTKIATENNLTLSLETTAGCPWQRGFYVLSQRIQDRCRAAKEDAYKRVIPALRPDVIILAGELLYDVPDAAKLRGLDELAVGDRDVVIIEPGPLAAKDFNPLTCLSTAKWLEDCRYVVSSKPSAVELYARKRADESDHLWSADFDRLICPFSPICDPVIGNHVVKWDRQHISRDYSKTLAGPITTYLRDNGLIAE